MISSHVSSERLRMYAMQMGDMHETFAHDVTQGFAAPQKTLPAKYFYDARGSQLYEQICDLPEYYPYRAELQILDTYASDIHAEIAALTLVEFGPGNAAKTRYLLAAYERAGHPFLYCPVDISATALEASAVALLSEFSHLSICGLHADFAGNPEVIQRLAIGPKALAFFGSSLGNFTPEESVDFLQRSAALMGATDVFLLGIDLKKSPAILVPAYDDAQGVTAAFNLNVLRRMNRELGGTFHLDAFEHVALYNEVHGRIEMHLRSRCDQEVTLTKLDRVVKFAAGETIHTENSYKYSVEEVRELGRQAGLTLQRTWFDQQRYFLVCLFRRQV